MKYKQNRLLVCILVNTIMKGKKLFLIDAYALIYRAYYAFIKNPRINSKGFDTSTIMGFFNSILIFLKEKIQTIFQSFSTKEVHQIELKYLKIIKLIEIQHLNLS